MYARAVLHRTRAFVLLLASVLALGCGDKAKQKRAELDQDRRRVSVESTHDASTAVVDEGYRFRLGNPGPGWKTVPEAEARKLNPDAMAMAINDGTFAAVFVEQMPGVALEGYVDLLLSAYYYSVEVELREPTQFAGHPAIRVKYTEADQGVRTPHEARIVIRDEFVYRVDVWRVEGSRGPEDFSPVFAAFSLLDGEVVPREPALEQVRNGYGTGWLLDQGTFRSAISGFEITADDSLRMLIGGELQVFAPEAEVGFMGAHSSFFMILEPQPWDTLPLAESRSASSKELTNEHGEKLEVAAFEVNVVGQPVPLDAWTNGPMRYYLGVFELESQRMRLQAWWPDALDQGNRPRLLELASRIQQMDEYGRTATAAALTELPIVEQAVERSSSIRNGTYRDFARGIVWTAPRSIDAAWVFLTGASAQVWDPDATVVLFDRRSGRYGALVHVPGAGSISEAAWRKQIEELWPGIRVTKREPFTLAKVTGELVHGEVTEGPRPVQFVTLRVGEHGYALLYESPRELDPAVLHELVAGLQIHERLPAVEQRRWRWTDQRMGVALEVPTGWKSKDQTPEPMAAYSHVTTWTEGDREQLSLLEMYTTQIGQDLDWTDGYMEQLARDAVGSRTKDLAKRRTITIGGEQGRELSWSNPPTTVRMVRKGAVFCVLIASGATADELDAVSGSLEFLP